VQKSLEHRRILVVEDQYLIAMEVEDVLLELGAEVIGPFAQLKPALQAAHEEELHGAVLDVRLDSETTEQVACLLVARSVPVLLATGYDDEQLPPDLRNLPRLRKPFDPQELRAQAVHAYR
jgi:DNA-binding response OmpR family regulator